MNFLEKDLEKIIFETPNELLQKRGLGISGKKKRQVNIGNYGIADIITINRRQHDPFDSGILDIQILELKQKVIDYNALKQIARYTKGVEAYFKFRNFNFKFDISISMILIGNQIDKSDFVYLIDYIDNLTCYTYSYDFNGINFTQEGDYELRDKGFKIK